MIPITQKMRDETKADLEFGRLMPDEIKKTALPQAYKNALQAFKDQAKSVTSQIRDGKSNIKANKTELKAAQARMASHAAETRVIYRLLMSPDETLNIDTLDEQRLAQELGYFYPVIQLEPINEVPFSLNCPHCCEALSTSTNDATHVSGGRHWIASTDQIYWLRGKLLDAGLEKEYTEENMGKEYDHTTLGVVNCPKCFHTCLICEVSMIDDAVRSKSVISDRIRNPREDDITARYKAKFIDDRGVEFEWLVLIHSTPHCVILEHTLAIYPLQQYDDDSDMGESWWNVNIDWPFVSDHVFKL